MGFLTELSKAEAERDVTELWCVPNWDETARPSVMAADRIQLILCCPIFPHSFSWGITIYRNYSALCPGVLLKLSKKCRDAYG